MTSNERNETYIDPRMREPDDSGFPGPLVDSDHNMPGAQGTPPPPGGSAATDAGGDGEHADREDGREDIEIDDERVAGRAMLRPTERQAGSDDPEAQARAILEDSETRQRRAAAERDPDAPPASGDHLPQSQDGKS